MRVGDGSGIPVRLWGCGEDRGLWEPRPAQDGASKRSTALPLSRLLTGQPLNIVDMDGVCKVGLDLQPGWGWQRLLGDSLCTQGWCPLDIRAPKLKSPGPRAPSCLKPPAPPSREHWASWLKRLHWAWRVAGTELGHHHFSRKRGERERAGRPPREINKTHTW